MRFTGLAILGVTSLLALSPAVSWAEPLAGRVIDGQTLQPLAGAEISNSKGQKTTTDEQGYFRFADVPRGPLVLRTRSQGYELSEERIRVPEGGILDQSILLFGSGALGEVIEIRAEKQKAPERVAPGAQEIRREEITKIPGTRGDALQSVRSLPGVANAVAQGNGPGNIVIRGAAPEDSKIMIDGVQVPLLYHFFGFQSVLPSEFIESIEYQPGGFGAEEGNATGGVINVKTRRVDNDKTEGFAEVSFVNLAGLVLGPVSKEHNLHFAVAARRSLLDYVVPLAIPEDANVSFVAAPIYYDGQLRFDWQPKYSDRVSALLMASSDELALLNGEISPNEPELMGGIENTTRFVRPIFSWHHEDDKLESTLVGSFGAGSLRVNLGPDRYFNLDSRTDQFRSDQVWTPTSAFTLRGGVNHLRRSADIHSKFPLPPGEGTGGIANFSSAPLLELNQSYDNNVTGGYMSMDYRLSDRFSVSPGMRLDYFHQFQAASWGPRVSAQFRITDKLLGRYTMGSYTRSAEQAEALTRTLRPEEATQYVLGGEYQVARGIQLQSSLYYSDRRQLIVQDPNLAVSMPEESYINLGYGRSFGVETTIRAQREDFFGWITYTLSKSDRIDNPLGERRLFDYDQTHNIVALASYKLGAYQLGGRFQASSGRPYTPVIGNRFLSDLNIYVPTLGKLNSDRFVTEHQLDLRVDRKWHFETWELAAYLDVTNVYANPKTLGYTYNFNYSERSAINELPILPSLGVRGSF